MGVKCQRRLAGGMDDIGAHSHRGSQFSIAGEMLRPGSCEQGQPDFALQIEIAGFGVPMQYLAQTGRVVGRCQAVQQFGFQRQKSNLGRVPQVFFEPELSQGIDTSRHIPGRQRQKTTGHLP